jgi:hypothetical protein
MQLEPIRGFHSAKRMRQLCPAVLKRCDSADMHSPSFEDALAAIRAGFAALERSRELQASLAKREASALPAWRRGRHVRSTPLRQVGSRDDRVELLALLERLKTAGRRSARRGTGPAGGLDDS